MTETIATNSQPSKGALWTGWILTILPSIMLLSGAIFAWTRSPQVVEGTAAVGWNPDLLPILGTIEIMCVLLFLIPRTAVFGALLLTAYFGGAVATHVRIGQHNWYGAVIMGIVVWAAMLLREPRLRSVLPLRK
ncbi:MAG TPA: DoxX family protein [Acidobacteriaceae bacterium]|jgi:hypothetical protein